MKPILLAVVFLGLVACKSSNKMPQIAQSGEQIYRKTCARCHGYKGEGGFRAGRYKAVVFKDPSEQKRLSDQHIENAILNGRPMMPPFKAIFGPAEVKKLTAYIRTLGPEESAE